MFRLALVYGGLAGGVVIGITTIGFAMSGGEIADNAQIVGYLIMFVALSVIFLAIKQYRDARHGGVIKFWPALTMGLAVSAVAGVVYVAVWEVFMFMTDYAFYDAYAASVLEAERARGASEAELNELSSKIETALSQLSNPLFRLPITFLEIFPVGALISLISAAILRNPGVLPARTT
ncbi:MAG: DUF4199 domain-containing protein [Pseudomonadota bacterium]